MKKVFLGVLAFVICSSSAWAVRDYKGYRIYVKAHTKEIKEMEKACNDARGTKAARRKCDDVMQFRLEGECRYGINPNACKALDELKKMEVKK